MKKWMVIKMSPKVRFVKESPHLSSILEIWWGWDLSKVRLSRLPPGHTAKMEISHPGNYTEGIQFCSVLSDNTSVQETPKLPCSGYLMSAAMLRSFLRNNATYSNSCQVLRILKFQNFSLCMISPITDRLPPSYIFPDLLPIHKIARPHVVL